MVVRLFIDLVIDRCDALGTMAPGGRILFETVAITLLCRLVHE